MTYTVSSGTLNPTIPYHTIPYQAEHRPVFKGLESDSTARSHVCLGRPTGRLQSGGGFRIAAETAW